MLKLAANLSMMFGELPWADRFAAAARAGFKAVEFQFPYEWPAAEIAEALQANGLECGLINLPAGDMAAGDRGLASVPGREAAFRDALNRGLEYALALGAPRVHALAGLVPPGADRRACRACYIDNLRAAADTLAPHGRTLLIEPLNVRDMPGYFLTRQADAHEIRREVGRPNLEVQMDFYHAQIMDGDLTTTFRENANGIGHLQIAGVPGRHEPDPGEIDYAYVLKAVDDSGYAGWIGCEYKPRAGTADGLSWIDRLRDRGAPIEF